MCHSNCNGNDGEDSASTTVSVIINPPAFENTVQLCSDGLDNDNDQSIDLADSDCSQFKPTLTVIKNVVGGTATSSDFTIVVTDPNNATSSFLGSAQGTLVTFNATGTYSVSENLVTNYTPSYSTECSGSLNINSSSTCTITNTYVPPVVVPTTGTLIVKKIVNGGQVATSSFSFQINQGEPNFFDADGENIFENFATGTYSITEVGVADYGTGYSENCSATLVTAGATSTCTITNTYTGSTGGGNGTTTEPTTGTLTLIKNVVNDNVGTSTASDFHFTITRPDNESFSTSTVGSVQGVTFTLATGTYAIAEDVTSGYTGAFSGDCNVDGQITVVAGQNVTCTVTNSDDGQATSTPVVENNGGGSNGGGGGSSGSRPRNGGSVLGLTFGNGGQVLGASTCANGIDSYIKFGANNKPEDVKKLQGLLNELFGVNLPLTGFYGPLTRDAVNQFQLKYTTEVLLPWVNAKLHPDTKTPTGYVFKTTLWWANELICGNNAPAPIVP